MRTHAAFRALAIVSGFVCLHAGAAAQFQLPTANRALFKSGGEDEFFAATPGRDWRSGTFGCVRSDGMQMHEGLDIRSIQRDSRGEPTDPVLAAADGTVAYINRRSALSNYGQYIVVRHSIEGIEVHTLYAHLREVSDALKPGSAVAGGAVIGTMGRTTNTKTAIARDRAHVHFEIALLANERFENWHERALPGQRNDHGRFNGQNLLGLDPRAIFLRQRTEGAAFSLVQFIRGQTELCRVLVLKRDFPWVRRCFPLIKRNPLAESEGVAGYELRLNFNGVPFQLTPRAPSEMKSKAVYQLLSVNEEEQRANPARKLVARKSGRWELTTQGAQLLDLLTY
jgi:murein DD-endopeptidase MepM/ murein hydrolase activator NlpD